MINFFWQLFCAMDLDITNRKRAMEEGPDEEFNDLEYEVLCILHLKLEETWSDMEDILYLQSMKDVREVTNAEQRAIDEDLAPRYNEDGSCNCDNCRFPEEDVY